MPDLSFIIVNRNTRQLLLDCIESIYQTVRAATFEIFVVDNNSADGSRQALAEHYPEVTVIANTENQGFAKANNAAIRLMAGRYAVLLNSDTLLKKEAADKLYAFMESHPEAGMCGPQLLNRDGSKQTSAGVYPELVSELVSSSLVRFLSGKKKRTNTVVSGPFQVDFIIGACMFARKAAIDQAGMLDEDYFFFYEEIDWCFRMNRAGWRVYHRPDVEIFHFGGGSTRGLNLRARVESWRSRYLFFHKSLRLGPLRSGAVVMLGFIQTAFRFTGYTLMNLLSLFAVRRLRRRWLLFSYLLLWHLRGMPVSMGIPRN